GALLHRSCQSTAPLSSSESLRPRGIRQNSTSQPATEAATADRYTHPGAVVQKISSSTVKIGPPRAISHASVGNGSVAPIGGGSGGVYPSSSSSGMSTSRGPAAPAPGMLRGRSPMRGGSANADDGGGGSCAESAPGSGVLGERVSRAGAGPEPSPGTGPPGRPVLSGPGAWSGSSAAPAPRLPPSRSSRRSSPRPARSASPAVISAHSRWTSASVGSRRPGRPSPSSGLPPAMGPLYGARRRSSS